MLAVVLSITIASGCAETQKPTQPATVGDAAGKVDVYFSPHGGCQEAVIGEIDAAQKSVRVQAYSFTNARIAEALLRATKRGVDVEVILDHSQMTSGHEEFATTKSGTRKEP
jgi:phosphatidylserine/phosphatidylglycerophosphate/cardiolipin synthase-like enzyme